MPEPAPGRDFVPSDHSNLRHGLFARALDEIYWPKPAPNIVPLEQKEELYSMAFHTIGNRPITYLEFGVNEGWSFRRICEIFRHPNCSFFGFDSFEGLPEPWAPEIPAGHFHTGGKTPEISDQRAEFIKGWFQNTVPAFLGARVFKPPVLVHFDADLYSSTLFLLTTLWHHIPEYYFIFDEFQPDEIVAMRDFSNSYPFKYEFLGCTQDIHRRPQQIFGTLRNVPFKLGAG